MRDQARPEDSSEPPAIHYLKQKGSGRSFAGRFVPQDDQRFLLEGRSSCDQQAFHVDVPFCAQAYQTHWQLFVPDGSFCRSYGKEYDIWYDVIVIIVRLQYYPFFLMQVARLWSLTLSCLNSTTATAGGQPLCCTSSLAARSPAKHKAAKFQDLQSYSNNIIHGNYMKL